MTEPKESWAADLKQRLQRLRYEAEINMLKRQNERLMWVIRMLLGNTGKQKEKYHNDRNPQE